MELTLESLGLSKEEIQNRVVQRLADDLKGKYEYDTDEEGRPIQYWEKSSLYKQVVEQVTKRADEAVAKLAETYILPRVSSFVEGLCLTETNKWGEKTGGTLTFTEYLVKKAEEYLTEKVNYNGKSKSEESYSWTGTQTRLTFLVHQHLHYSIESAMKDAVKNANAVIVRGLEETVKMKLSEIASQLKVNTQTK